MAKELGLSAVSYFWQELSQSTMGIQQALRQGGGKGETRGGFGEVLWVFYHQEGVEGPAHNGL